MERTIINTNIRLNLNRPEDRRAWEYLQCLDRKKYKSYSRAVVAAINDHFSREERLAADPYLETREKEDAFLEKVLTAASFIYFSASATGNTPESLKKAA